ncbi:MAG: bile acid:sodium symporter family protein [Lentisphaerae bacterium]|nr:bile acid:sodium symporter family protein [Lentisphaerota bacterium]
MLNRVFSFYTKYFAFWVVAGAALAVFFPKPFELLSRWNTWFFGVTMFGVGAVLKPADFGRIVKSPTLVLIGSAGQFTIMPIGAFVIAGLFRLPDEMAVGLILAGCVPGAMASNVMSYVAKADAAYSVSLTTVSTLLCAVLTPLLTKLLAGVILPVDFWKMFSDVMLMVVIPLGLGFSVRAVLRKRIDKMEPVFLALSVTFIVFICSVVMAKNRNCLLDLHITVLAAVIVLNVYGMLMGYGLGKIAGMSISRRRTLSIEIGMQNAGLGTVLALNHFGAQAAIPTAMFVFICILTASAMAEFWQRKNEEKNLPAHD